MKISNEQKKINRAKIIKIAVDLIIEGGYKSTTMRGIAKKAGFGDATIYNYFPTKESILFAYYEDKLNETVEKIKEIKDFNEYTINEQLQTVFHIQFEIFLSDREFIAISFKKIFLTINQNYKQIKNIKDQFRTIIKDIFDAATEADEIPPQIFEEMIFHLIFDYYIGIVLFWLNDSSEKFNQTTILTDKSLDLICSVIEAGVANKLFDLASYFFKNHILSRMGTFKRHKDTINIIKREFMGSNNG
jgi:AcrR family transcriptional regulator